MGIRYYIVPVVGDGSMASPRQPKYFMSAGVRQIVGGWMAVDYGLEPTMIVRADVTAAEHASIAANVDVIACPADLTTTVGVNLVTVKAALASVNIPSGWVLAAHTYRQVVANVCRIFAFMQRFHGMTGLRIFSGAIDITKTFSQLSATRRQQLQDAADSFGIDRSGVTLSTTIGDALKMLADQLHPGANTFKFGEDEF